MAHNDVREGKWRGNWPMEWVAGNLHTTSEHGVSSITIADAHTSVASSRLNWRPCRFKWTRPFRRKTKSGFCACAITFKCSLHTSQEGKFQSPKRLFVLILRHKFYDSFLFCTKFVENVSGSCQLTGSLVGFVNVR